jgi:hypothetical protein
MISPELKRVIDNYSTNAIRTAYMYSCGVKPWPADMRILRCIAFKAEEPFSQAKHSYCHVCRAAQNTCSVSDACYAYSGHVQGGG